MRDAHTSCLPNRYAPVIALSDAIEAYRLFDLREPGWTKVELRVAKVERAYGGPPA